MSVHKGAATELYEYQHLDGSCAWQKVRFDLVDDETGEIVGKTFRPRYQTRVQRESGSPYWWTWGDPPWIDRYPYELPALFEALIQGDPVWIVEGEKDVHCVAENWGYAATTHPSGSAGGYEAAGWSRPMCEWFARGYRLGEKTGRRSMVTVVADADPTGLFLAARTWQRLRQWAQWDVNRIRVVLPAVEEKGADISDHIAAGWSESSLVRVPVAALRAAEEVAGERIRVEGFRVAFGSGPHVAPTWRLRRSVAGSDPGGEELHSEVRPCIGVGTGPAAPTAVPVRRQGRTSSSRRYVDGATRRRDTARGE